MKKILRAVLVLLGVPLLLGGAYLGARVALGAYNRHVYAGRSRDDVVAARAARTFYVSPAGDDAAAGTSPEAAWRTTEKVNGVSFAPGDQILFAGGQTFAGGLRFDAGDVGTPARPLTVGSYGAGRATISAGAGTGVEVRNTSGFRVADLDVKGAGREANAGTGVAFVNDLVGDVKLDFIRVERVEVSGFGKWGVLVDGNRGKSGFRGVRLTHVSAHDNALAGIYVYGEFFHFVYGKFSYTASGYAHEDVYVGYSRAYNNPGVPGARARNTGSGIVLSDVDGGMIERSVAHDNGRLCESLQGGPVGIWAWDSNNVTIQFNESYRNRVAGPKDGGGFDLDGGMTNSVMQYNYSHDNDGAGYMLAQFPNARPFAGNVMRYNISQNDGRRNGYAAIHVWGEVRDTEIHNNTVYVSPAASGAPRAVFFDTSDEALAAGVEASSSGVRVCNNIFQTAGGVTLAEAEEGHQGLILRANAYFAGGADFRVIWRGAAYGSLEGWRAATGQERDGASETGTSADPQLRAPGGGGTIGDAALLGALDAYRLRDSSPLIEAGLDLSRLFGINPGGQDYYGNPLPQGAAFDVGVHEAAAERAPRAGAAARHEQLAGLAGRGEKRAGTGGK